MDQMTDAGRRVGIGDNSEDVTVRVQARLFNSLSQYAPAGGPFQDLELAAGSTVEDIIRRFNLPYDKVFLVLCNGRDVTPGLVGGPVNTQTVLDDGDVIALSGPVPYSYGYGAPIV